MEILLLMLAFSALSMNCYAEKKSTDYDTEVVDTHAVGFLCISVPHIGNCFVSTIIDAQFAMVLVDIDLKVHLSIR